jgi:para-aminobenzoate synthetase
MRMIRGLQKHYRRSVSNKMIPLLFCYIISSIIPNTVSWTLSSSIRSKNYYSSVNLVSQQRYRQWTKLKRQRIPYPINIVDKNLPSNFTFFNDICHLGSQNVDDGNTTTNDAPNSGSSLFNNPIQYQQQEKLNITVVIIDHYDSFTYNLVNCIKQICTNEPIVVEADSYNTWNDLSASIHKKHGQSLSIDAIILSPGPGNPSSNKNTMIDDRSVDDIFQLARDTIHHNPTTPILGVCLGHQIIGDYYGATVTVAPQPIHGQIDTVIRQIQPELVDDPLYQSIPSQFNATRYHSLQVLLTNTEQSKKKDSEQDNIESKEYNNSVLIPTSVAASDNVIMSMKHYKYPHWGVQYHPESIGSVPYGMTMIQNFLQFASSQCEMDGETANSNITSNKQIPTDFEKIIDETVLLSTTTYVTHETISEINDNLDPSSPYDVYIHKIQSNMSAASTDTRPIDIINKLFDENSKYVIWLDGEMNQNFTSSSLSSEQSTPWDSSFSQRNDTSTIVASPQQQSITTSSPISIISGQFSDLESSYQLKRIEYWGKEKPIEQQGLFVFHERSVTASTEHMTSATSTTKTECTKCDDDDVLSYLNTQHRYPTSAYIMVDFDNCNNTVHATSPPNVTYKYINESTSTVIPFDYRGGHLGYLGYEVRHDTLRYIKQDVSIQESSKSITNVQTLKSSSNDNNNVPTAAFLWADRSLVYIHETKSWYIVGVNTRSSMSDKDNNSLTNLLNWMRTTSLTINSNNIVSTTRRGESHVEKNTISDKIHLSATKASFGQPKKIAFIPSRSKSTYNQNFHDCKEFIRQGESYELCLTNHLEAKVYISASSNIRDIDNNNSKRNIRNYRSDSSSPFQLYEILRRRNPSPFSAFIDWNSRGQSGSGNGRYSQDDTDSLLPEASLAICCSSPERFVSVKKLHKNNMPFVVEAKPIKGTCRRVVPTSSSTSDSVQWSPEELLEDSRRASELHLSTKNRAENMMIVDLLRNDMSRVCDTGSIYVPTLFGIESFATVHQLVSTIRGTISPQSHSQRSSLKSKPPSSSAVNVLQALFPGGSMTGAPKVRTMELLDHLEEGANRGPYSGCLGYISVNGCMDMNIIIRTAILTSNSDNLVSEASSGTFSFEIQSDSQSREWNVRIGAGGAITALSESEDEYDEMLLKAQAVTTAVEEWANVSALKQIKDEGENECIVRNQIEIRNSQQNNLSANLNYTLIGR